MTGISFLKMENDLQERKSRWTTNVTKPRNITCS